jgi:hypothetical protein
MIVYEWIWVAVILATTGGAVAYCTKMGAENVEEERNQLLAAVKYERSRKKHWKALAKGKSKQTADVAKGLSPNRTIPMTGRLSAGSAQ